MSGQPGAIGGFMAGISDRLYLEREIMERFYIIRETEKEIAIFKAPACPYVLTEQLQSIPKPLSTYAEMIFSTITKGEKPL